MPTGRPPKPNPSLRHLMVELTARTEELEERVRTVLADLPPPLEGEPGLDVRLARYRQAALALMNSGYLQALVPNEETSRARGLFEAHLSTSTALLEAAAGTAWAQEHGDFLEDVAREIPLVRRLEQRMDHQSLDPAQVTEEERLQARSRHEAWMTERVAQHADEVAAWKQEMSTRLAEGNYKKGEMVGSGAYGQVVRLQSGSGPDLVGKFPTGRGKDEAQKEAAWYEQLGPHPNLCRCLGVTTYTDPEQTDSEPEDILVMESLEGGDVWSFVTRAQQSVRDGLLSHLEYIGAIQHIFRGVARGLKHLHDQGLYHSDMKPQNIMIDTNTGEAKIIDLGFVNDEGTLQATPAYRDRKQKHTAAKGARADGVAFGLTAFYGVEGSYASFNPRTREYYARRAYGGAGSGYVPFLGAAHQFVNRLTALDPDERPTIDEIESLPFLADPLLSEEEGAQVLRRFGRSSG